MMPDAVELLVASGAKATMCGSRVTCNPPPEDTDEDWLVEMPWHTARLTIVSTLCDAGWELETDDHYKDAQFLSFRRDNVNILLTWDEEFARRHHAATRVCKELNLMEKNQRISLFQAVLYGN